MLTPREDIRNRAPETFTLAEKAVQDDLNHQLGIAEKDDIFIVGHASAGFGPVNLSTERVFDRSRHQLRFPRPVISSVKASLRELSGLGRLRDLRCTEFKTTGARVRTIQGVTKKQTICR